jgi:hypothetical protein
VTVRACERARGAAARSRLARIALTALTLLGAQIAIPAPRFASAWTTRALPAGDFRIVDAATGREIGRSRFTVSREGAADVLRGDSRYVDGQYDVEIDRLVREIDRPLPVLKSYDHRFFDARGLPMLSAVMDFESGSVRCGEFRDGVESSRSARLKIPAGAWAGSSVLIPIQQALRRGADALSLYYVSCAPGPRLLTINAAPTRDPDGFRYFPATAAEVGLRGDFGWFNFIVGRFAPEIHAWFDRTRGFEILGAELPRFSGGPMIVMVQAPGQQAGPAGTDSAREQR